MNRIGQVIEFPGKYQAKEKVKERKVRNGDDIRYFSELQLKALRRAVRDRASTGRMTSIREWAAIDLLTSSGLRVSEAADVRCGDVKAGYGESAIFVRDGKGSKSRTVEIPASLTKHLRSFIAWKADRGEPTGPDDPLFVGQRGPWTAAALQQLTKKFLRALGLYERGRSCHSLRHSYAVQYYRRSDHDLKGLQRQLGHSSISTTGDVYVNVLKEDIQANIKNLWN